MNRYLGEFTFRSFHRLMQNAMFDLLIGGGVTMTRTAFAKSASSAGPTPAFCAWAAKLGNAPGA